MACVIGHMVIMYTKMSASFGHFNEYKVDVYYSNIIQSNAYMYGTTYLTRDSGPSRGNITYNKWKRSWTGPFSVIPYTSIVMYVITTIIMTLEMTCISRALEGQSKIVLDICDFNGVPIVTIAHLVYVIHWVAIRTWNSMCHRGHEKQDIVIKRIC